VLADLAPEHLRRHEKGAAEAVRGLLLVEAGMRFQQEVPQFMGEREPLAFARDAVIDQDHRDVPFPL
jgi:hypothetical protein